MRQDGFMLAGTRSRNFLLSETNQPILIEELLGPLVEETQPQGQPGDECECECEGGYMSKAFF